VDEFITVDEFGKARGFNRSRAYEVVARLLPPGVVVKYGRQIRINTRRLAEFEAQGGRGLPKLGGNEPGTGERGQ
jgi:hypothetical protein